MQHFGCRSTFCVNLVPHGAKIQVAGLQRCDVFVLKTPQCKFFGCVIATVAGLQQCDVLVLQTPRCKFLVA